MVPAPREPDPVELARSPIPMHRAVERGAGETSLFRLVLRLVRPWIDRARSFALGCAVAMGCGPGQSVEVEGVVRDGRTGEPIAGALVTSDDGASARTDAQGHFEVRVPAAGAVRASAEGRCDARTQAGRTLALHLFPRMELVREHAQVGFDTEVRIAVRTRCDHEELRWEQIAGPALGVRMRVENQGRLLVVRTHPLEELVRLDDRLSVLALDRTQRGDYRLRVSATLGGAEMQENVRITAAPTAAGVFQVPTGTDVYLNGGAGQAHRWEILERPRQSEVELHGASERIARFRPDRFGTYLLAHDGVQMTLQAGAYEDIRHDCGREGCHATEDEGWTHTAHAATFRRGLDGELGEGFEERCWSCHATGVDVGIDNGGLHQTAARIGWEQPAPDAGVFDAAPRRIRRHGAVWCSACHGPGRIVPPQFRWQHGAKFQVGVCARCHDVDQDDPDAEHRSPEVDEWRLAAMSQFLRNLSDDDPALREGCASCHSAQGFVEWRRRDRHVAPDRDTVQPLTCPTCHDPHDASRPYALRVHDTSDPIAGSPASDLGSGALCASCHRSGVARVDHADRAPHAPQADMLIGRGARTIAAPDAGVHRPIADTCVRCHMTRPPEGDAMRERAGGHTFAIRARAGAAGMSRAACSACHGDVAPERLGERDWDGDGTSGPLFEEHDRALASLTSLVRERVAASGVRDACAEPRAAASVREHDALLVLSDSQNRLLGDCDGDGRWDEGESPVGVSALPRQLADAIYDWSLLAKDGSRGAHNPAHAFRVMASARRALH